MHCRTLAATSWVDVPYYSGKLIFHRYYQNLASYPGPLIEGEEKGPGTYCTRMRQLPQENLGCRKQLYENFDTYYVLHVGSGLVLETACYGLDDRSFPLFLSNKWYNIAHQDGWGGGEDVGTYMYYQRM